MNKPILQALANCDFKKDILRKALLFKRKEQAELFKLARQRRRAHFPFEEVEVRSVIEISNICQRRCNFCNINSYSKIKKYIIKYEDLVKIAENIYHKNRRVILVQSGENRSGKFIDFVCKFVRDVKQRFSGLKIILCLGSLSYNQYKKLHQAGADRYILKFETSNPLLYKQIKPDCSLRERIKRIKQLSKLGFEVGTGNIIGLPNQTVDDIIDDLLFINNFKLTMASTSVFIPPESSNYWNKPMGDVNIALNYTALMRIMYPALLIPSTSSLERAKRGGQYLGLIAGANTVTIHNGTPVELKKYYPIYSVKRFTPDENYIKNIVKKAHSHFK